MVDIAQEHGADDHDDLDLTGVPDQQLPPPPSVPSRRRFLAMAGGTAVTVAVGGAVAGDVYAGHQGVFASGSGPAYAPWDAWDQGAAPLRLVRAAILAANAHNAQAWRFAVSPRRIEVYDDTSRSLGTVDPYGGRSTCPPEVRSRTSRLPRPQLDSSRR